MPLKYSFSFLLLLLSIYGHSQSTLGLGGDLEHSPFIYGVASGDPTPQQVIIWTAIEPTFGISSSNILWELALDEHFCHLVQTGNTSIDAATDWTLSIDLQNLNSFTTYYYRFFDNSGNCSAIGRTRTASAAKECEHFRFAVASCSSLYSGYFNAYKRIAERDDIDGVIHLGDYIYEFVDEDEEVRVPNPYPAVPANLQEWRNRHKQYLLDPDLRAARQQHPWITIFDNHEVAGDFNNLVPRQAFYEFVPMRLADPNDPLKIYRSFDFGDALDIFMIDINTYRNIDPIASGGMSILGEEQYNWLINGLQNSTAKWILIGQQKLVGGWNLIGLPDWFPGDGTVFDENSWDGNDEARDRLLNEISAMNRDNIIFLSGDLHLSLGIDLSTNPFDGGTYDGDTGNGAVAVEFMPTGVTRGNFDEAGVDGVLVDGANALSEAINVHHVYSEFEQHGYGIIDIDQDSTVAEFWYSEILNQKFAERFGRGLILKDGINHWERNYRNTALEDKIEIPYLNFDNSDCTPISSPIFSVHCNTICLGESFQIYNNADEQNQEFLKSYVWDFGDGNTSAMTQPLSYSYQSPGSYTISMQETLQKYALNSISINSADCSDPAGGDVDLYVEIYDPDNGLIFSSNPIDDTDPPVTITPNSLLLDENKYYLMRIMDSDSADADDECGAFYFTASTNGLITNTSVKVDLSISPQTISTQSYFETVTVLPNTHPECIANSNEPICNPIFNTGFSMNCDAICTTDSIHLINQIYDANSLLCQDFSWDFGDGTASSKINPPRHFYPSAGNYTITLQEEISQFVLSQVTVESADCEDTFLSGNVDLFIEITDPILGEVYVSNYIGNDAPPVTFNINLPIFKNRLYNINIIDDDAPDTNDFCGSTFFSTQSNGIIGNDAITLNMNILEQVVSTNTYSETIMVSDCTCPPNFAGTNALNGASGSTIHYETDGIIESDMNILSGANIDYDSGTQICLEPGFEVILGALFHAYIDGCSTSLKEKIPEKKNP